MAVGVTGQVTVVDTENHRIQQFDATGRFIRKWGNFGSGAGQFVEPRGVAAGNGQVYVADTSNHRLARVRPL